MVKRDVTWTHTDSPFRLSAGFCLGMCREAMVGVYLRGVMAGLLKSDSVTFAVLCRRFVFVGKVKIP